jgi:3-hydroxyisobutyrate dehydrogenase-like beta-hydroxyacid dehydrogenase
MKVGFIGLGHMGAGMASSLLKAGHEVTVYNRTKAKAKALTAQGAKAATTIAEACLGDAVITMLANDAAVESVVLGRNGVIASLSAGVLHVPSSTISIAFRSASRRSMRRPASALSPHRYSAAPRLRRRPNSS